VARVRACTVATVPTRHDIQEGTGLHAGALRARVAAPPAQAQDHAANVRSAEQAHLEPLVSSTTGERGVLRGASGGSAVKIERSVARTGAAVPLVWLLRPGVTLARVAPSILLISSANAAPRS
jgi:hypothetical protein